MCHIIQRITLLCLVFSTTIVDTYSQTIRTMLRLPDTGQNTSYTNTFGEDADYTINAPSYIRNGNGTITDTITGLMWQQNDGGEMSYQSAMLYADTTTLGGFNDWRLPTALEAYSILNLQNNNPALNTTYFTKTTAEYWWTSNRQANDTSKVYCTNAGGGIGNHRLNETISTGGTKRYAVRVVRSPNQPRTLTQRFTTTGATTILDNMTDVEWTIQPHTDSLTWEDALSWAEQFIIAEKDNWRLPNIKELQSLTDVTKANPAVDNTVFSSLAGKKFWSSTTLANQAQRAWYWDTQFGITTYADKIRRLNILLVRTPSTATSIRIEQPDIAGVHVYSSAELCSITSIIPTTVYLYSLLGEQVLQSELSNQHQLLLSHLPHGQYYCIVRNNNFHPIKTTVIVR
jgi:hypothetical protein